jgi:hypothetical protein
MHRSRAVVCSGSVAIIATNLAAVAHVKAPVPYMFVGTTKLRHDPLVYHSSKARSDLLFIFSLETRKDLHFIEL